MSRVGKKPIIVPDGVDVIVNGDKIVFSSGKIRKELDTHGHVSADFDKGVLSFSLSNNNAKSSAFWGTYRALANNIIVGMSTGFVKQLEINGVGYKASVNNKILELHLGFSHVVNYTIPDDVEIIVDKNLLTIKGIDKQQVGQVASDIRKFRPPEPYKGKGIKYSDEIILRKAGKTVKK